MGDTATWAPGGRRVTFLAGRDADSATLFVADVLGGEPTIVADGIPAWEAPQWSPAEDLIAYSGTASPNNGVVTIRPDGTDRRLVPTTDADGAPIDPGLTCCAVWSADGSHLLFQVSDGGPSVDLYTMRRDGTDLRRLTHDPGGYSWYGWGAGEVRYPSGRSAQGRPNETTSLDSDDLSTSTIRPPVTMGDPDRAPTGPASIRHSRLPFPGSSAYT